MFGKLSINNVYCYNRQTFMESTMKTIFRIICIAFLCVFVSISVMAVPKAAKAKPQTTCPVMKGQKIKKNLFVDVKGKRIYVCCPGCINKIKKYPDKYIKAMEKEGVVLEDTPKKK
jgi:hypothetical protein